MDFLNTFLDTYTTEIVGGLLASIIILLFTYIQKFLIDFKIKRKYSGYIGDYYLYEFSSTGLDTVFAQNLSIKSKLGRLILESKDPVYSYTGTMDITERNLYIHLFGIDHLEQVHIVFHSPLHRSIKKLIGTLVAISPIDEPIAKYCILSDEEISLEDAKKYLLELTKKQTSDVLRVEKNSSLYFDNLEIEELAIYNQSKDS